VTKSGRRKPGEPIEDAADMLRVIEEVASAPEAWNTFHSTGNAAAGWEAYRRSRAGGGKPPEAVLRWLDEVAAAVLQTNGEPEAVLAAMGCPRPERGGPGPVSRLAKQLETQALCSAVWLAATGGRYTPGDAPPREGVAQALRQVAAERGLSVSALERRWHRWAKAPDRAPISGVELQRLLAMR
jgi:hypothetical protein